MPIAKSKTWLLASRPKTLWAAVSPVLMGTAMAYADGFVHWPSAAAALFSAILIQIGTNFANDYFDYSKGADTTERIGPTRATQAGMVKPDAMRKAFIIAFGIAMLLGLYLVWRGGWIIVLIGSVSIFLGIIYTATPYALAYTGLADIFVLIFFGPVAVGGTYYVQALDINAIVLIAGLSPGLISTAILTVNNLRDVNQDRAAGRKTLAVRFGVNFAKIEYLLLIAAACLMPLVLHYLTRANFFAVFATLTFFLAIPAIRTVFSHKEAITLNTVLANTGKLLLIFSLAFSIGWII
ncbi:MAG: 1,4-dihydroxy-2-naphthoate polyprenyltransferase [bacterium]